MDLLIAQSIPFIDVGIGLSRQNGALKGMLRTTYFPVGQAQAVRDREYAEENERPADIYRTNIQISELNALNASLAVMRFKQLRGFYEEESPYHQLLMNVSDMKTFTDVAPNAN